jgi:hypothetical protein
MRLNFRCTTLTLCPKNAFLLRRIFLPALYIRAVKALLHNFAKFFAQKLNFVRTLERSTKSLTKNVESNYWRWLLNGQCSGASSHSGQHLYEGGVRVEHSI